MSTDVTAPANGRSGRRARLAARIGPLPGPVRRVLGSRIVEGLATPHGVSRYLEALHPLWSLSGGRAVVTEMAAETPDSVTLTLRPDHTWSDVRAGQHVRLGVEIDGVVRTRTYSVSSSEHRSDGQFTVTVKRKAGGLVSGYLTAVIAPGDVVACSPPTGDVVLPAPRPERLVLISGGSGITPMAAMLRTLSDEDHPGRVTFLHYARTSADVAFGADLARIAADTPDVEVAIVTTSGRGSRSQPSAGRAVTGRFRPAHLDELVPDHLDVPAFACGPAGLVDAVEAHYAARGAAERLQVERFSPPALRQNTAPGEGTVRFAASDLEVVDDGRSLLEQAETAGLAPEFGCRLGICHTCTHHKVAGGTLDLRSGRRSDASEEQIQLCVSVAAGDVVLDL